MDKFVTTLPRGVKRKKPPTTDVKENKQSLNLSTSMKPERHTQMYIDVGQKSFGKSIQCDACKFFYVIGELDDEKEHRKFCTSARKAVSFTTLKNLPTVTLQEFENDSKIISVVKYPCAKAHLILVFTGAFIVFHLGQVYEKCIHSGT